MRSEFMVERNGRAFCLYAGLLDEAHQQGLSEIRTTLLQVPSEENGEMAICHCEVRTEKGVFSGIGDASPRNVARAMVTCLIRMAETRAKARALRDAVNVGVVALEEINPEETAELPDHGKSERSSNETMLAGRRGNGFRAIDQAESGAAFTVREPLSRPADGASGTKGDGSDLVTPAQKRMLEALARQIGETVDADALSRKQASQLITEFKNRVEQAQAA